MSATAAVPAPSWRGDLTACDRHWRARLRLTARDPLGLAVLAFAGAVTVPLWTFALGIHPLVSMHHPWPGGPLTHAGGPPTAVQLAVMRPSPVLVLTQALWALLVSWAVARRTALAQGALAPPHPALPLGTRARVLGDALAAVSFVTIARVIVLALGGLPLARILYGHDPRFAVFPDLRPLFELARPGGDALAPAAYVSASGVATALGVLQALPLVLAWTAAGRLDVRGLVKPAGVLLLSTAALAAGALAHLVPAGLVCAAACAFVLVRVDDGERDACPRPAPPLGFRACPGPEAQLRRDAWRGVLERRGVQVALAVALPFLPTLAWRADLLGYRTALPIAARALAGTAALVQWLALTGLALFPFGLPLLLGRAGAATLFSGAFARAWAALPASRPAVVRAVYAHGVAAAGLAWVALWLQAKLLHARADLLVYPLPVVFLVAGLALCEAVGDRSRGLVAVGALMGLQFGLPLAHASLGTLEGLPRWASGTPFLVGAAYAVALAGILPPLVHLRRRPRSPA